MFYMRMCPVFTHYKDDALNHKIYFCTRKIINMLICAVLSSILWMNLSTIEKENIFLLTEKKRSTNFKALHQFLCMLMYQSLVFIIERLVFTTFIPFYCSSFLFSVSYVTLKWISLAYSC